MLSMNVKIFQKNDVWVLEVGIVTPQKSADYFFRKSEFKSAHAAKMFFYENIGLFVVQMGQT